MKKLFYKITKKYWTMLSYEHAQKHNFIVQNGIFKGLQINKDISWGRGDIASKVYGFYENKIQKILKDIKKPILIDIGAADGYFAIGSLHSGLTEFCYAFEQSENGKKALLKTAEINKVSSKLSIKGKVNSNIFLSMLPKNIDFSKVALLCDIEGDEYNLFTNKILNTFKKSCLIIEIHNNVDDKIQKQFFQRAEKYFKATIITDNEKEYLNLPELHSLNDIDRSLLACEGRSYIGKWLYLKPL